MPLRGVELDALEPEPLGVEAQLVEATRSWDEDLLDALRADAGEEEASRLHRLWGRGLPEAYKEAAARNGRTVVEDSRQEAIATLDLNEIDAVLTCSRVGISISGTIVLDGEPDQGRRAISLVPDKHVVVLERESIMPTVPQAVDVLGEHPTRPMTWIAGGSATSDIELVRVNGVHGPRNLRVVIAH